MARMATSLGGRWVSTHSIRYRILKVSNVDDDLDNPIGFNPFDPIQDTESVQRIGDATRHLSFNPFDPIQDTERSLSTGLDG